MNSKKNIFEIKKRGFIFSIEATISLIVLILIISTISIQKEVSLKELVIVQQQNDLLRVWSNSDESSLDNQDLINDTKQIFNDRATLYINEEKILVSKNYLSNTNCISSEGIIIEKTTLLEKTIKIILCE